MSGKSLNVPIFCYIFSAMSNSWPTNKWSFLVIGFRSSEGIARKGCNPCQAVKFGMIWVLCKLNLCRTIPKIGLLTLNPRTVGCAVKLLKRDILESVTLMVQKIKYLDNLYSVLCLTRWCYIPDVLVRVSLYY